MTKTRINFGSALISRIAILSVLAAVGFGVKSATAQSEGASANGPVKFTTLHSFDGTDGEHPYAGLVQATNGDFYGTTETAGTYNAGTIFKITSGGVLTTVYNFCLQSGCTDGAYPGAGLVEATNGDLYGTTFIGGAYGYGSVFKIAPNGTLTTLYSFCAESGCRDGQNPQAALVQATNGDLYGTTSGGGNGQYDGTVFKITPNGTLTTLYSFCPQAGCKDGAGPLAGLVQATNGDLYGTTDGGGANGHGTIFKITPGGTLVTLYSFCALSGCPDGDIISMDLVQATDGDLYGTTYEGGANGIGTIFKITPTGAFTTVYSFCSAFECSDGGGPYTGLIQATDGNLYGTTTLGGSTGGTIFKVTPEGALTTLYSFCTSSVCAYPAPIGGLVEATNGKIYGATQGGGTDNYGTVFSLFTGQAPFVETMPAAGHIGERVTILGNALKGSSSVTFNGIPAIFKVESETEIRATVPAGATTGKVEVVTPERTLSSNVPFRVQ